MASAFDQYCDLLLSLQQEGAAGRFNSIVDSLRVALGQDAHHLFNVIPKLQTILGERNEPKKNNNCSSSAADPNLNNSFFKLQHLLSQFVDVISKNSDVSVVLLMDDVQWADEASLAILNRILRQKQNKFFFIGTCRDDEMAHDHSFWKMIDSVQALGVQKTQVKLGCMDEDTLNKVVSDLLCVFPRRVRSLSSVLFSRTKGNALFFMQLLLSLHRDRLLYLDFGCKRWVWNEEKIVSMKLPDNIAVFFTSGITKLGIEIKTALHSLAMFGASAKVSYLVLLETHLGMHLVEPLKNAAAEGLVTNMNGSFHFCHDRIQEVSLNLISEQDRRRNHLAFGKCLVKCGLETGNDNMLFTAVDQINLGGPSVIVDQLDYFAMAEHNLAAGKNAQSMSDFALAFYFFKSGISFLRDGHWQDNYSFSLEIFNLAFKSAVASGKNIQDLSFLSEQVLNNASFEDTLNIQLLVITVLAYSDPAEALKQGLWIVSKLGEEITSMTKEVLEEQVNHTQEMIEGISEELFLNYQVMRDTKKLIVMKFLARLQSIAYMISPDIHPVITLKMLQFTMSHGE